MIRYARSANPARSATRAARFALAAVLAALALTACSSNDQSTSFGSLPADSPVGPARAPEMADGGAVAAVPAPPQGVPKYDPQSQPTAPVDQRSLIYTGTVTVRVDNVAAVADQAIALATGRGGLVSADNRTIDADRSLATLVFRVPADLFTPTLDAMGKLGTEESRQVQAQDVTDTLIDLDARIATQEASVDRVRALLARAQTIGEITSLESELTRRQADLDSLKQRRAKAAGLVALATITVVLHGPSAPSAVPQDPATGFMAGLRSGWRAFLGSVKVVLTFAGWLLPWAIAIGAPVWLVLTLLRRRRRSPTPPAATPGPPLPPAPPSPDV